MTTTIIFLIATHILSLIDYYQTVYAIQLFGIGIEANPIARFLFENNYAWAVKLIIMPIILTIIGVITKIDKNQRWAVYLLFTIYFSIVLNNFLMLMRVGAI